MGEEEINKTIAEFMGFKFLGQVSIWWFETGAGERMKTYTQSLDALIPVMEKLKLDFDIFNIGNLSGADKVVHEYAYTVQVGGDHTYSHKLSYALSEMCAKIIKENR